MRYVEKRPAPYTMCQVGAPGHVDEVYMKKTGSTELNPAEKIRKYKPC